MGRVNYDSVNLVYMSVLKMPDDRTGKEKAFFVEKVYQRDSNGEIPRDSEGKRLVEKYVKNNAVTGFLTAIGFREIEANGKKFKTLDVELTDGDEKLIISVPNDSRIAEDIIYSLDSVKDFSGKKLYWGVSLSSYNGKEYIKSFLAFEPHDNALNYIPWSLKPNERVPLREMVVNGQTVYDRTDRLKDMETRCVSIQNIIKAAVSSPVPPTEEQAEAVAEEMPENYNKPPYQEDNDIPW